MMKTKPLKIYMTAVSMLAIPCGLFSQTHTADYWNDPDFVASFMGSYGFLPEVEPKINSDEIEFFRELLEVIQSNPKAAAARLSESITDTSSAALVFVLGNLHFQTGESDKAIAAYKSAIEKFPNYRRVYENLGIVYFQAEHYQDAVINFAKSIELGNKESVTYGRLGYSYVQLEDFTAAEEAYRQAILFDPETTDWKEGLAQCLLERKAYEEAEILFTRLIAENPDDAKFWRFQANTYIGQENPYKAASNLEVIKGMGAAEVQDLILLGDIYLKQLNIFDEALKAYTLAIRKEKTPAVYKAAFSSVGIFNYFEEYKKSEALIQVIRQSFGEQLTESDDLDLLVASAKIARAQGDDAVAAEILESIIERDPLNGKALLELAKYYSEQGEIAKAEMKLKNAQGLEAFKFKALVQHAQLLVQQKKFKEAVPLLKQALQLKEDSRITRYLEKVERASKAVL